jgi:hypothetical protein
MSELELSLFRQRSQEALKQKARRGVTDSLKRVGAGVRRAMILRLFSMVLMDSPRPRR